MGSECDEVAAVLRYTQRLDPDCSEEAIRRYVQEITEMGDLIDQVDLVDLVGHGSIFLFSPSWGASNIP